jgi:hypothetical protein
MLLEERFGSRLRELVLFGSHATGEAHEDSDVDILVVIEGLTPAERGEVMDLAVWADAADREHWVGLAPLPYSELEVAEHRARERRLFRDIERVGVRV